MTVASQRSGPLVTVVSAGQTITGAMSLTVTTNVQVVSLPAMSVTVNDTSVIPIGNTFPLASPAVCVVVGVQLSVPTGAVYITTAPALLAASTVMSAGQEMAGFSLSTTVIVKEQSSVPAVFVAVAVTVVVPNAKLVPGA